MYEISHTYFIKWYDVFCRGMISETDMRGQVSLDSFW